MKNINISEPTREKLVELKLQYKKTHEANITYMEIVKRLVMKAKFKDIE
jgi:hypothetical protein